MSSPRSSSKKDTLQTILGTMVIVAIGVFIYYAFIKEPQWMPVPINRPWDPIGPPTRPWDPIWPPTRPWDPINPPSPPWSPISPRVWKTISQEGGTFSLPSPTLVRYGSDAGTGPSYWISKVLASGSCSNAEFNGDPIPGVVKHCEALVQPSTFPANLITFTPSNSSFSISGGVYTGIGTGNTVRLNVVGFSGNVNAELRNLIMSLIHGKPFPVQSVINNRIINILNPYQNQFAKFGNISVSISGALIG